MFDLAELKKDVTTLKVVTVDCLVAPEEEKPTITIELNTKIRERERQLNNKYNGVFFSLGKKSEGKIKSDSLHYALDMADLCVTDSRNLFMEKGAAAAHSKEGFALLLRKYPRFLRWFLDTLTETLADDEAFRSEQDEEEEKN